MLSLTVSLASKSEVYFSPDDKPRSKLLKLIKSAKHTIYAAVYMITDKHIVKALIKAKDKHNVDVQVITDKISMEGMYSKGTMLVDAGIDVFVFDAEKKVKKNLRKKDTSNRSFFFKPSAIMHNKFAVIDDQVWTGSFNWTQSANQYNQENVIVTDEQDICDKYEDHFEVLKERCTLAQKHAQEERAKKELDFEIPDLEPKESAQTAGNSIIEYVRAFFDMLFTY